MSNTIQELQAKVEAKINAIAEQTKERATVARLQAKLNTLDNPIYQEALVAQERQQDSIDRLTLKVQEAEAVVTTMPIYDNIKKQDKRWNGRPVYGHGIEISTLYTLLSGIMYSAREHKQIMLAQTGLSEALVESTVNAFGQPSYFSIRNKKVIPEVPYNVEALQTLLPLVATALDVEIPMHSINEANFSTRFEVARERAEKDMAEHELTELTVGNVAYTMSE